MLLNIVLGLLVIALAWSKFSPRNQAREKERCKLVILHRIKSCGKSFGLELAPLCGVENIIYPYLRDMEAEGLLETKPFENGYVIRDGRPRIYYFLTPKGEEYADASARSFLAGNIPKVFLT